MNFGLFSLWIHLVKTNMADKADHLNTNVNNLAKFFSPKQSAIYIFHYSTADLFVYYALKYSVIYIAKNSIFID
jgi:hypothetical protein